MLQVAQHNRSKSWQFLFFLTFIISCTGFRLTIGQQCRSLQLLCKKAEFTTASRSVSSRDMAFETMWCLDADLQAFFHLSKVAQRNVCSYQASDPCLGSCAAGHAESCGLVVFQIKVSVKKSSRNDCPAAWPQMGALKSRDTGSLTHSKMHASSADWIFCASFAHLNLFDDLLLGKG